MPIDGAERQQYGRRASDVMPPESRSSHPGRERRGPRIRSINALAIILASILALAALVSIDHVFAVEQESERINSAYQSCTSAARDLQEASDYLTSNVRVYVVTGNRIYLDNYLDELLTVDRRGKAVETLKEQGGDSKMASDLEEALSYSNELAERELYAMKLTAVSTGLEDVPSLVDEVELSEADAALTPQEQRLLAEQIVLGDEYQTSKTNISSSVNACTNGLISQLEEDVNGINAGMHRRLARMKAIVVLLLCLVVVVIFAVIFLILWPLASYTHRIIHDQSLVLVGADELRYLARAYNLIYEENRERTIYLKHAAERDALTGLYNRGAYDALLAEHVEGVALLLIDVDYFKSVNDTYGHDMGDAVLKKVSSLIAQQVRSTDFACRIGGDEFSVIMTDMPRGVRHVVVEKVESVMQALLDTSDGLPKVTLSIGIAFSGAHEGEDELYKAADKALYVVKERGRNGYAFYGEA